MDKTIDMAREAGACDIASHGWTSWVGTQSTEFLKRFEALVRADERDKWMERAHTMILGEREACASIADSMDSLQDGAIGEAIRARGNT